MSRIRSSIISVSRDPLEDELSRKKIDRFIFQVLLIAIGLIPLLIGARTQFFISPEITGLGSMQTGYQSDFFTYFKFIVLVTITIIIVIAFLYKLLFLDYKMNNSFFTYSAYLFIMSTILSVYFAEYKTIAFLGMPNRHDGALTFLCYTILMIIATNISYSKNSLKLISFVLYPFVWINAIISLLSYYGINVLTSNLVYKLLTLFNNDNYSLSTGSVLTGTLNQWNYMSGASGIMVMIFLTLAVFANRLKSRVINLLTALAAFATLLVSISSSGFLAFFIMAVFLLIILILKGGWKKGGIILIMFIILSTGTLSILAQKNPKVWDESLGNFIDYNPFISKPSAIELNLINSKAYASDETFSLPTLPKQEMGAGSGRVYIWTTMLELLKDKPFFGYGFDTILFHFPQNDLEKRGELYWEQILVDKPHSMYLGVLWGTGIIGFIGFMGLIMIPFINIVKRIFIREQEENSYYVALTLGVGAFLIQAFFNDSVIGLTIAPIIIIAMLYTVNQHKKQVEEKL